MYYNCRVRILEIIQIKFNMKFHKRKMNSKIYKLRSIIIIIKKIKKQTNKIHAKHKKVLVNKILEKEKLL